MTALNFLVTIITMRAPGMTFWRMPLLVWANFTTSLLVVLATPFTMLRDVKIDVPLPAAKVLSEITATDGKVFFSLTVDAAEARAWEAIRAQAEETVRALPGIKSVMVALNKNAAPSTLALDRFGAFLHGRSAREALGGEPVALGASLTLPGKSATLLEID